MSLETYCSKIIILQYRIMSHTAVKGLKTDLDHIEFARERYVKLAESIREDLQDTIAPHTKIALTSLMEFAESGARLALRSKEILMDSVSPQSSSH